MPLNSLLRAARAGNMKRVVEFIEDELVDINASNQNGLTALHSASKEGHTRIIEELISRGANVHAKTLKGNTALHIASLAGHEPVVRLLIANGADVDAQSVSGFTALYMAAQENHESIVRLLLANGANQNIATTDGFTPLAVAMQQGHEQIASILLNNEAKGKIRFPGTTESGRSLLHIAAKKDDRAAAALLIQNNISPDVTSKSGFTALHVACHYGNESVAKLLIDRQADVNFQAKHNITPLHVAAKWGQGKLVNLLLANRARIDATTRDGLTPLHCAARSGHDQVVEDLIRRGAPISAKTRSGLAPLHMATQGDHLKSAQILLSNGAPVDDVTVDYLTALHVASHCGHVNVAKLLLASKADPNFRAQNGFTSLHIACKKNRLKIVELLLKHGASMNSVTESGLTPLHVASFMGCVNIVIYLLDNGAQLEPVTVRGETPLHLATRANQIDVINVLLRYGANVDARAKESQTALHIAARLGNADIARLLIEQGIDVDAPTKDSYTALHIAAKEGHESVVAMLLDNGANISCATRNHGFTPLHLASKYGIDGVVDLLLSYGAPVDAQGKNGVTSLHVATHYDHPSVVQLLLMDRGPRQPGASPHAMAKNGYTALHIAAKGNRLDIADAILRSDANPNAESKAGFCPLHLAAQEGRADMAALLLNNGAKVNCRAKNGITPLHLCAQEDHVNVAQLLVKRGAFLDEQTKGGFTPLHVASHFARLKMIRFLLANGANVNIPAASGYTPVHQASQQGNPEIVELLLEYNAKPDALTESGQTALSIAENLGYVSIVDTLRVVTETVVKTTRTTVTEEKFKIVAPETMQETFVSDSEDEADDQAHAESVRFLTTDVMKNFNSSMADDYATSQSNLTNNQQQQQATAAQQQQAADNMNQQQQHQMPTDMEELEAERRALQQRAGSQLAGSRPQLIVDEMQQDLQYLAREAPLDGGESTFGAYSQLGGGSQHGISSGSIAGHEQGLLLRNEEGDDDLVGDYDNDPNRSSSRQDSESAALVANYARGSPLHRNLSETPTSASRFAVHNELALDSLAPDNVDIQRPLQQAGDFTFQLDNKDSGGPGDHFAPELDLSSEQTLQAEIGTTADLDASLADEQREQQVFADSANTNVVVACDNAREPLAVAHEQSAPQVGGGERRMEVVGEPTTDSTTKTTLPIETSTKPPRPFLVSFMVDARGGAMRGCRHSGVRVIIPPNSAQMPMRITCRYLRRERLVHPPMLMEGEACASKILEVGPAGAKFLGPVLIEVPHFASLRGQEREIIILRSETGDVWREDPMEADEALIEDIIRSAESAPNQYGSDDKENISIKAASSTGGLNQSTIASASDQQQQQQQQRLTRIVTTEFPQYFAIISRIRQEVHAIGPQGAVVDSQLVPKVQAIFTEGALTKRIKIGLQKGGKQQDAAQDSISATESSQQLDSIISADNKQMQQLDSLASTDLPADQRPGSPQSQHTTGSGNGRPLSASAKRRSRFLACFGAGHGSVDLLNSTADEQSSGGGDSPRVKRDLGAEGGNLGSDGECGALTPSPTGSLSKQLVVPEDYYIEREPPLILNVEPTTYGKRLASSSAQTDSKLNVSGYLSTSARTPKKRSGLLRKRRRNKTQMTINLAEDSSSRQQVERPKSSLGHSMSSPGTPEQLIVTDQPTQTNQQESDDSSIIHDVITSIDHKWRTCTIQTDSDSVTVNYVTIAEDSSVATSAKQTSNASTQAGDDGYVSGSGDLNRQSSFGKGLFGLSSCKGKPAAVDEDEEEATAAAAEVGGETSGEEGDKSSSSKISRSKRRKQKQKEKKKSKKSAEVAATVAKSSESSAKEPPVSNESLSVSDESKTEVVEKSLDSGKLVEAGDVTANAGDESLSLEPMGAKSIETSASQSQVEDLTERSSSPSSAKESKLKQKLEKQEKVKREKEEKRLQKEREEQEAKAEKLRKKQEKEQKKQEVKAAKLAAKKSASPPESKSSTPLPLVTSNITLTGSAEKPTVTFAEEPQVTSTATSVSESESPDKSDSIKLSQAARLDSIQQVIDSSSESYDREKERLNQEDGSDLMKLSLTGQEQLESLPPEIQPDEAESSTHDQLISFSDSSLSQSLSKQAAATAKEQQQPLKPILKHQQSSLASQGEEASAEISIREPKVELVETDRPKLSEIATLASNEAVKAADALKLAMESAVLGAGDDSQSPDISSSASLSKKELAKAAKEEKARLKREAKEKLEQEKRAAKESKEEADRLAREAKEEAKRVAREATEAKKAAEEEAKRLAKQAKAEKERLAKEEKEAKKKLKLELKLSKSLKSSSSNEEASSSSPKPSAPTEDLIESSTVSATKVTEEPSSEPKVEISPEARIKIETETLEITEEISPPAAISRLDQEKQAEVAEVGQPKTEEKSDETTGDTLTKSEESASIEKEDKTKTKTKIKKEKKKVVKPKKVKKEKKSKEESSSSVESPVDMSTASKSSGSFFSRLFSSRTNKKGKKSKDSDQIDKSKASDESSKQQQEEQKQPIIVSEMYPSDPNNADGEMILEVNVPTNLIAEQQSKVRREAEGQQVVDQLTSQTSTLEPLSTTIDETLAQSTRQEQLLLNQQQQQPVVDDQEATLVNMSQTITSDNDDDEDATENVISQAQDLTSQSPVLIIGSPQQVDESVRIESEEQRSESDPISQVADEIAKETVEAAMVEAHSRSTSCLASSESIAKEAVKSQSKSRSSEKEVKKTKEELKVEKERKELESKLAKEAKKREKEEAKQKKKDEELAKIEAKRAAKEEKKRKELEAKEAKRLAKLAKDEEKRNKRLAKSEKKTDASGSVAVTSTATSQEAALTEAGAGEGGPQNLDDTVIINDSTVHIDEIEPVDKKVETFVEEVVGEDGVVTKTTRVVETEYVTLRKEEVWTTEKDVPVKEYEAMIKASASIDDATTEDQQVVAMRRKSTASSKSSASSSSKSSAASTESKKLEKKRLKEEKRILKRVKREEKERQKKLIDQQPTETKRLVNIVVGPYEHPELEEIRATPSYFSEQLPAEIKPETAPNKVMKKRFKLNGKLIKRATKLARSEAKKAKINRGKAEAEIVVCDEAARRARKQLKKALHEAKKAQKLASKEHKKMDKVDKQLAKNQRKIEKRQAKIDKQQAKLAKKAEKKREKEAKKEAKKAKKLERKSSSKSSTSRKSIKLSDIGEPVLRSSSKNFSTSGQQLASDQVEVGMPAAQVSAAAAATAGEQVDVSTGPEVVRKSSHSPAGSEINVEMSLDNVEHIELPQFNEQQMMNDDDQPEVLHTITRETIIESPDGQISEQVSEQTLRGQEAIEASARMDSVESKEQEAEAEEEEIDVVTPEPTVESEEEADRSKSSNSSKSSRKRNKREKKNQENRVAEMAD